ncbi:MAG: nitroreductase family protein [Burkholderiales bacterium]
MAEKRADTSVPIHELLARRWSPRAFDNNKAVSRAQIKSLLEAARWAPSCFGDEPWRYLVWDRNRDGTSWKKAFECLAESNQTWVKNAPLLLASIAAPNFTHNGKPNRWAQHDTGAASENLVLQAVALGLAAHQMGGFDAGKLSQTFAIPEGHTPMAMIAIGYQAAAEILEGEIKMRELAPRARKALGEKFFEGGWGRPVA